MIVESVQFWGYPKTFSSVFSVTFCQKFVKVECLMYETRVKIHTNQYVVKGEMWNGKPGLLHIGSSAEVSLKKKKKGVKEGKESRGKLDKHLIINLQDVKPWDKCRLYWHGTPSASLCSLSRRFPAHSPSPHCKTGTISHLWIVINTLKYKKKSHKAMK